MEIARFRFNAHLLETLGRQYRSTEEALKELVANAWDADATIVRISLPQPVSDQPIVIEDNGHGMTPTDLKEQYLNIGYDRRQERGSITPNGRTVRGNRGIGKFAALEAAETMTVTTTWFNRQSHLVLSRAMFGRHGDSLESADISITVTSTNAIPGTVIELSGLRKSLAFPDAGKLNRLLLREFGVRDDFVIYVDGSAVTREALDARKNAVELQLADGQQITGTFWLSERPMAVAEPGITIRVNGRAIGTPTFFGLESDPEVPRSLRNRLTGEVNADHLVNDVLSSWGGFIENSTGYQDLAEACRPVLKDLLLGLRDAEGGDARDAFVETYREKIEQLPPPRRDLARAALLKLFDRFYDEAAERKHDIAELVLDAFEQDEYWVLVQRIRETSASDISQLAEVLEAWGLFEVNGVVVRARQRLAILAQFEALIRDMDTLELRGVHHALKNNLWLLGDQYELLKSNTQLDNIVRDVFEERYTGTRGRMRPDLLLVGLPDQYLLVEFKRPRERLDRGGIGQGETYRDELRPHLPNAQIDVVVMGGTVEPALYADPNPRVMVKAYREVLVGARQRLEWLVENLEIVHEIKDSTQESP